MSVMKSYVDYSSESSRDLQIEKKAWNKEANES